MAIERRDPLPAGRYWIDLFSPLRPLAPDGRRVFADWAKRHEGRVLVESREEFLTTPLRTFVIFRTSQPLPWGREMGTQIGFPTIAPATGPNAVNNNDDTAQRPRPLEESNNPSGLFLAALIVMAVIAFSKS